MNDLPDPHPVEDRARSKPHVLVRALVGVTLVAGMAVGWSMMCREKARKQQLAVKTLRQLGARVYFDYQWDDGRPVRDARPPEASWLRRLLGDAIFDRASVVDLRAVDDVSAACSRLKWLPYLRQLDARTVELADEQLETVVRKQGLRKLDLSGTPITDEGAGMLYRLPRLQWLSLAGTRVSDSSVAAICLLKNLRHLDVSNTAISADGLRRLQSALPRCRIVADPPPTKKDRQP